MDSNGIVELLTTMDKMKYLIVNQKQKLEGTVILNITFWVQFKIQLVHNLFFAKFVESEQDVGEKETEWKVKSVEVQYGLTELEQTKHEVQNSVYELVRTNAMCFILFINGRKKKNL